MFQWFPKLYYCNDDLFKRKNYKQFFTQNIFSIFFLKGHPSSVCIRWEWSRRYLYLAVVTRLIRSSGDKSRGGTAGASTGGRRRRCRHRRLRNRPVKLFHYFTEKSDGARHIIEVNLDDLSRRLHCCVGAVYSLPLYIGTSH